MAHPLSRLDRLRVERTIWTMDTLVGDLPARRRREIRAELRGNVYASAAEHGMPAALRRLGNLRRLAADYLDAEFTTGPRPRWAKGLAWALVAELILLVSAVSGATAFTTGVETTDPAAGTYTWAPLGGGVRYEHLVDATGFAGFNVEISGTGLLTLVLIVGAAFFVGGRMWRAMPPWSLRTAPRAS